MSEISEDLNDVISMESSILRELETLNETQAKQLHVLLLISAKLGIPEQIRINEPQA